MLKNNLLCFIKLERRNDFECSRHKEMRSVQEDKSANYLGLIITFCKNV